MSVLLIWSSALAVDFAGEYELEGHSANRLSIESRGRGQYSLRATGPQSGWHGYGYILSDKLICVFIYDNNRDGGFVTYRYISNDKLEYESRNTDGSLRLSGVYNKVRSPLEWLQSGF